MTDKTINSEELQYIKEVASSLLVEILSNLLPKENIEEVSKFLASYRSDYSLFSILVPRVVSELNNRIFASPAIRHFVLEYTEYLSLHVATLNNDAYERIINTFASASVSCKAKENKDETIAPILVAFGLDLQGATRTYRENPWLVSLVLINLVFERSFPASLKSHS